MTTSARTGRTLLLRDGTGTGATTIAAMRTTEFTINGESVDVTDKDSAGQYRELLAGAGIVSVSVSAAGILHGATQHQTLVSRVIQRSTDNYTVAFDNGDTLAGPFQITSFQASGDYNNEQTYSLQLESAGSLALGTA